MNLGDLPATLFSPAKTADIGFIVLAGLRRIATCLSIFAVVTLLFIIVEVVHNDLLRIWLKAKAMQGSQRSAPGGRQ
jgi:hypothetical protein